MSDYILSIFLNRPVASGVGGDFGVAVVVLCLASFKMVANDLNLLFFFLNFLFLIFVIFG